MANNKKALNDEGSKSNNSIITENTEECPYKCKDPALLFYSSDFIADTIFLSLEQIGKLALLMAHRHWQEQRLTKDEILKICRDTTPDPEIFSRYKIDNNGFYYNATIEKAIEKRKKYSESRSKNKKGKTKKDKKNISKSYENHIEDETEILHTDAVENSYNNQSNIKEMKEIVYG